MGLYDPYSDLRLRILITRTPQEITGEFFRERLKKALALRADLAAQETTGYRVVNGENDGFANRKSRPGGTASATNIEYHAQHQAFRPAGLNLLPPPWL